MKKFFNSDPAIISRFREVALQAMIKDVIDFPNIYFDRALDLFQDDPDALALIEQYNPERQASRKNWYRMIK